MKIKEKNKYKSEFKSALDKFAEKLERYEHNEFRCRNRCIEFSFFCCNMSKTVDRLHAVVRKERGGIGALKNFSSFFKDPFRITIFSKHIRGLFRHFGHLDFMSLSALQTAGNFDCLFTSPGTDNHTAVRNFIPFYFQSLLGVHHLPGSSSNYNYQLSKGGCVETVSFVIVRKGFDDKYVLDAGHSSRFRIIY